MKKFGKIFLKALFSLSVVGFLLSTLDFQKLYFCMKSLPWYASLALLGLLSLQLLCATVRWFYILQTYKKLSFQKVLETNVFSTFLQNICFGFFGSFILKLALIRRLRVPLTVATLTLVMDRIAIGLTLLLLSAICSFFFPLEIFMNQRTLLYLSGGVVIFFIGGWLGYRHFIKPQKTKYLKYIQNLKRFSRATWTSIFFSLISLLFYFLGVHLISYYMGLSLSFKKICLVMPIITLVSSFPIAINGWGLRETAMIVGLGFFGVSREEAFVLSVIIGIFSILGGVPLLAFTTLSKGIHFLIRGKK